MTMQVSNSMLLKEIPTAKNSNISYRAGEANTFERNPEVDTFGEPKKNKKTIGTIAGIAGALALVTLGVCYAKGKGPEGTTKKFGERIKDGWKSLWKKASKNKDAAETINEAKSEADEAAKKAKEAVAAKLENLSGMTLKKCKKEQIAEYIGLKYAENPEYAKLYDYCANSRKMKKLNLNLNELSEILDKNFGSLTPEAKDKLLKSGAIYKKFREMNVSEFEEVISVATKELDADIAQGIKSSFKLNNGEENVMNFWKVGKYLFSVMPKESGRMFKIRFKPISKNKNMMDFILSENFAAAKKKI